MRHFMLLPLTLTAACTATLAPLPAGRSIDTPAFETYVTGHNGFSRVRLDHSDAGDAAVIAQFEDADPVDPTGYRSLIALDEALYGGRVSIEVLAEVDTGTGATQRLLRLTTDQSPFLNESGGQLTTVSGQFHLRGANFAWVSIDGGPLLSGSDAQGLVTMVLDFDTETVSLNLRTGVSDDSQVRVEITATDLPLNIRTGAYGDDIVIQVWDPESPDILLIDGSLRGNFGGTPVYGEGEHDLSTSGLYIGDGEDPATGRHVRIEGLFVGRDPNVQP